MRLEGKVEVVTGAASGIGRESAVPFAVEGPDVLVVYAESFATSSPPISEVIPRCPSCV